MKYIKIGLKYKADKTLKTIKLTYENYFQNDDVIVMCYSEGGINKFIKTIIIKPKKRIDLNKLWLEESYDFSFNEVFINKLESNDKLRYNSKKNSKYNKIRSEEYIVLNNQPSHAYLIGSLDESLGKTRFIIKPKRSVIVITKYFDKLPLIKKTHAIDLFTVKGEKDKIINQYLNLKTT
ncbi:MAG: hypothetical protein ACLFMO_03225 [Eubacteriales bacterium]